MAQTYKLSMSTGIKMTIYRPHNTPHTCRLSLSQIWQECLLEEKVCQERVRATTHEMQQWLAEATLEIGETLTFEPGSNYEDLWEEDGDPTMNHVSEVDNGDNQDNDEDCKCTNAHPVFSSRAADHHRHDTCMHANNAWQAQMPGLVDIYLSWKHSPDHNHINDHVAHISDHVFHVTNIGVFAICSNYPES
ncbi:hypothetical protein HYDPIDRAFT_25732 [Hydnomerulius pinastri MD-312]|nr:hypothetical protein HYDPIDRAFT_25732 [Hydnomerulius pinastri MD-312]